ncbi:MAG: hypothetical protein P8R04_05820, partial [Gammaproteobacteria bacterium]|nr:hypothetical protein [Gammaproteobacteria bacterium]
MLQSIKLYRKISQNGIPFLIMIIFVGCGAGIYAWIGNRNVAFLSGSLIMMVMFPLSGIFISPIDRVIENTEASKVGLAVENFFKRWRRVHIV